MNRNEQHRPKYRHDRGLEVGPLDLEGVFNARDQARYSTVRAKYVCIALILFGILLWSLPYWP